MSQRDDFIKLYEEQKQKVSQTSMVVILASLTLLAISRSPNFKLDFGAFKDGITSGYVVVFGPLIIFALTYWYYARLTNCIAFRDRIITEKPNGKTGEDNSISPLSSFLLLPPHIFAARFAGPRILLVRNKIAPHMTLCTATLCFLLLIDEYLQCRSTQDWENWPMDILIGSPIFTGFPAIWDRAGGNSMPWVYPPFNAIIYLSMMLGLIYFIVNNFGNYATIEKDKVAKQKRNLEVQKLFLMIAIMIFAAILLSASMFLRKLDTNF